MGGEPRPGRAHLPSGGLGAKPQAWGPPRLLRVTRSGPAPEAAVGARAVRAQAEAPSYSRGQELPGLSGQQALSPGSLPVSPSKLGQQGADTFIVTKVQIVCQVSSPLTKGCDLHILPKSRAQPGAWLRYPVLALSRSWGSFLSKRWTSHPLLSWENTGTGSVGRNVAVGSASVQSVSWNSRGQVRESGGF